MTTENNTSARLDHYLSLIDRSYSEVIAILLKKYGPVMDDYFQEKSYHRFLSGKIKTITHGKYKRTSEGLYTHHIGENTAKNLSKLSYIMKYKYSFELQRKEELVYTDLLEHLILHALIAKETNGQFGYDGFCKLKLYATEWYVYYMPPTKNWQITSYNRSLLTKNELKELFRKLESGPLAEKIQQDEKEAIICNRLYTIIRDNLYDKFRNLQIIGTKPYLLQFKKLTKELATKEKLTDEEILVIATKTFRTQLFSKAELKTRINEEEKAKRKRIQIEKQKKKKPKKLLKNGK